MRREGRTKSITVVGMFAAFSMTLAATQGGTGDIQTAWPFDMMGLLWEWCSDRVQAAVPHVSRGATFGSKDHMFKSSIRLCMGDAAVNDRMGMRVIMETE